jgi:hemoglobin/transferrin/lactoferrin receptor protein
MKSCLIVLPLLAAAFVYAESTELPTLVVTPSRVPREAALLPFPTELRDGADIQLGRMSRTLPEALRELPSVQIQKTGHGQGSPFLRGWTGFRTLLLVDGVRLNNSTFRDGPNQYWNTVDAYSLSGLELVYGPGSVIYGSDAIGGTVQALTPDPLARVAAGDHGRLYLRGSTAEDSWIGRVERREALGENAAGQVGVTAKSFGDLRSGAGRQPKTGYEEWDVDTKFSGISGPGQWTTGYQQTDINDAWRTHRTPFAVPFAGSKKGSDPRIDFDQNRRMAFGRWDQAETAGAWHDLQTILSWQRQNENQYRERADGRRDIQAVDTHSYGLSSQASLGREGKDWTFGVDGGLDRVASETLSYAAGSETPKRAIQGPVGDDARYLRLGVFAEHRRALGERNELTLGARGEHTDADIGAFEDPRSGEAASFEQDWQSMVGSLRLSRQLDADRKWLAYAGASQGFRAPNLSDLTRLDTARSNEIEIPSTDLDPERFLQFEAGLRRHARDWTMELAAYHTLARDLITRRPTGGERDGLVEVSKANGSEGWVSGVESRLSWRPDEHWELWTALTWMEGEADEFPDSTPASQRGPLSRAMPFTGHAGIRHELRSNLWVETALSHAEKADRLSSGDRADTQRIPPGGTPGYTVLHLRGGWEPVKNTTLSLALENVTDENYRIHGSGLNEPGRNLILALERRF